MENPFGGGMRRILWLVLLASMCAVAAANLNAATHGAVMVRQLKQQHKQEMKLLKARHRLERRSMKRQHMAPAMRDVMNHKMQREERELRERHKDQMQDLKDQIRLANANRRR
jgi:hypothetical protein